MSTEPPAGQFPAGLVHRLREYVDVCAEDVRFGSSCPLLQFEPLVPPGSGPDGLIREFPRGRVAPVVVRLRLLRRGRSPRGHCQIGGILAISLSRSWFQHPQSRYKSTEVLHCHGWETFMHSRTQLYKGGNPAGESTAITKRNVIFFLREFFYVRASTCTLMAH